jgi:hypothetical protein
MPVAERNKLEPKGPEPDSEEIKEHILLQFLNPSVLRYLICFLGLILLAFCTFILGIQGTYHSAKDTAKQETEESFYNAVFELSESAHHLSNDITIQIQGITEIRNLEVLNVFLTDYQVWPEQETSGGVLDIVVDPLIGDAEAWIRFDGIGIFTVSLQNADFILDEQRKSVLVRVPSPVMERVLIQQDEDDVLYTSDAGLFNNASDTGQQLVLSLTQKAQQDMTAKARSNPEYYAQAKASAEKTITQLIKNLNPDLPDLTVEVEFID